MTFMITPRAGLLPLEGLAVPKPSLNQLWTEASSSRASVCLPLCDSVSWPCTAPKEVARFCHKF
jgi:hypothetical protein